LNSFDLEEAGRKYHLPDFSNFARAFARLEAEY
jgi:hypothetical protein